MAVSPRFAEFVVGQLDGCGPIVTKRLFGALGIYSGDTFFAIVDNDVLYLRSDDSTRPDFERAGCQPFRPYGDDRRSAGYYDVPVAVLENPDELTTWGRRAIAVARALKSTKTRRSQPARRKTPRR